MLLLLLLLHLLREYGHTLISSLGGVIFWARDVTNPAISSIFVSSSLTKDKPQHHQTTDKKHTMEHKSSSELSTERAVGSLDKQCQQGTTRDKFRCYYTCGSCAPRINEVGTFGGDTKPDKRSPTKIR